MEKILNQVHSSGKARKTLRKVLEQPKVLKFLKVRAKETGESIDNLAYKLALEIEEEISRKIELAEKRMRKALDDKGGADILNKTAKCFGGCVCSPRLQPHLIHPRICPLNVLKFHFFLFFTGTAKKPVRV